MNRIRNDVVLSGDPGHDRKPHVRPGGFFRGIFCLKFGFVLSSSLLIAGCAVSRPTGPSGSRSMDAAFASLAAEYLEGHLAWRPQFGVALGLHEYDGRLTDFRQASLDAELTRLKEYDDALVRFATNRLDPAALHDFQLLQTAVRKERFEFEEMRGYTSNPMVYAGALDVNLYLKRDFAPLEQRVRSVMAILRQASNLVTSARANLGQSLPRPYVETAIQVAEGSVSFLVSDLPTAVRGLTNASLRAELDTASSQAQEYLHSFITWLKEDCLPKTHDRVSLGRDAFAKMLRELELIALAPEEILAIGMRQLKHEQEVFAAAARILDPAKKPIEVFQGIQRDHPTAERLIPDTKKNLEAIRQFLVDRQIVTIPSEVRPRVEETPAYARATSFASMDTPGPFERQAAEAYYYVTPPEANWSVAQKEEWLTAFNYYTTDVVSIHEVWPGHYLQALCLNASPVDRLRKIVGSYAFTEGWAHYSEQMLLDEGFGKDADPLKAAKYRLAQSDEALLRLCRLCVAIRMHCEDMSVNEATRFFMENCYYEEKPARQEAMRATYDPGYLHYALGKLLILKLRDDYRKQTGPAFSLQRFHNELLRHGQPPIPLLRRLLLNDPRSWGELL